MITVGKGRTATLGGILDDIQGAINKGKAVIGDVGKTVSDIGGGTAGATTPSTQAGSVVGGQTGTGVQPAAATTTQSSGTNIAPIAIGAGLGVGLGVLLSRKNKGKSKSKRKRRTVTTIATGAVGAAAGYLIGK